ncbi:MAG: hypothetical protein CMK71_07510 [Pseudomonadaceae bacterium]|nr:hypothetical protein [Pseudomonadaceae bacterium]
MDSVHRTAIRQGDAIAQSTNQHKTRIAKIQKPIRATQPRRHDGSRDADSILRIQSRTETGQPKNRRMDSVHRIAIRQGDAIAQSTDQRKPASQKPKANPRNTFHRHDGSRDADSILRIQQKKSEDRRIGGSEDG